MLTPGIASATSAAKRPWPPTGAVTTLQRGSSAGCQGAPRSTAPRARPSRSTTACATKSLAPPRWSWPAVKHGRAARRLEGLEASSRPRCSCKPMTRATSASRAACCPRWSAGRPHPGQWLPHRRQVSTAMVHGGLSPPSDGRSTSVGTAAIQRFLRPVSYQNLPQRCCPPCCRDSRAASGAVG